MYQAVHLWVLFFKKTGLIHFDFSCRKTMWWPQLEPGSPACRLGVGHYRMLSEPVTGTVSEHGLPPELGGEAAQVLETAQRWPWQSCPGQRCNPWPRCSIVHAGQHQLLGHSGWDDASVRGQDERHRPRATVAGQPAGMVWGWPILFPQ